MTTNVDRARATVQLVRGLVSPAPDVRRTHADLPIDWIGMRLLDGPEQGVVGQLCVWAWVIETDPGTRHDLLEAVNATSLSIESAQLVAVFHRVDREETARRNDEMIADIDDFLTEHATTEEHLLDVDACRRSVDLARGITSTDPRERLSAARLSADVVASRELTDDEAGCFAGLLGYAVVVESDPAVRHEQATVLGIAAHHGRLAEAHREIAGAADLTDAERAGLGAPAAGDDR
jgi:hypothetical protein